MWNHDFIFLRHTWVRSKVKEKIGKTGCFWRKNVLLEFHTKNIIISCQRISKHSQVQPYIPPALQGDHDHPPILVLQSSYGQKVTCLHEQMGEQWWGSGEKLDSTLLPAAQCSVMDQTLQGKVLQTLHGWSTLFLHCRKKQRPDRKSLPIHNKRCESRMVRDSQSWPSFI